MRIIRSIAALTVAFAGLSSFVWAAPVESVESASASAARQKVDTFLSEKVVVQQLATLGISQEQARARVAQLSETQLQQMAAQVDLLRAGGMIQGGNMERMGPLRFLGDQFRLLCHNLYQLLFQWGPIK